MTGFSGTLTLVRLALRRDRARIPLWVLGIAAVVSASGAAVAGVYGDPGAVQSYAALVESSPVTVAFAGPPVGLDTLAGIVVYETSFVAVVGVSVMAIMQMARHTRAEEESGRSELLRSTQLGRHAPAACAVLVTSGTCVLLAVAMGVALMPTALSAFSAAVYASGVALLGVVHAAATLCLAQLFTHTRSVTAAGLVLFAVGYVVRAAGDVREDWLVWLSPVGWVQAAHVPVENRIWPLGLPVVATVALVVLATVLAERRDFGAGLLPPRAGPAAAVRWLSGPLGLGWRMQRGAVLGWSAGLLVLAGLTGTLGSAMQDMVQDNPTLAEYFAATEGGSLIDSYLATMALILGLVVGGFAVWSAGHPGADEGEGQLELVLSGPVDRVRVMLTDLLVTVLGVIVVLVAAAVAFGAAHGAVTDEMSEGWRAGVALLVYLPAILVLVGIVVLLTGWLPRGKWIGWVVLAFSFVIGWLGELLGPPQWVADLSPFTHVPLAPVEPPADWALLVLLAVAVLLAAGGAAGFRRRDIGC